MLPLLTAVAVVVAVMSWLSLSGDREALVVYCAHDAVYSQQILEDFERETGIPIEVRFDTEATKSLGLVELILREQEQGRCDVFWNNEQLGMVRLAEAGALEPYHGSGYERIPAAYKDPQGRWCGFAGRLRVWIVNTQQLEPTQQAIEQYLQSASLNRVAIAKPLFGTTRTHYTVLWQHWGPERLKQWHEDWRSRDVIEATGNAHVKNLVAAGAAWLGLTDTDDFYVGRDDGKPVAQLPYRLADGSTICIPNTVAIIRGTHRRGDARKLLDYLLSSETELTLARSKSRQIPLGPVNVAQVPDDVRQLMLWAHKPVDLTQLGEAAAACLEWLRSEYAP